MNVHKGRAKGEEIEDASDGENKGGCVIEAEGCSAMNIAGTLQVARGLLPWRIKQTCLKCFRTFISTGHKLLIDVS